MTVSNELNLIKSWKSGRSTRGGSRSMRSTAFCKPPRESAPAFGVYGFEGNLNAGDQATIAKDIHELHRTIMEASPLPNATPRGWSARSITYAIHRRGR